MIEHGTDTLRRAADLIESLAAGSTGGRWRLGGLLASRPEVIAWRDGATEHVADARAGSARWIVAMQPAVAPHLAGWLRAVADRFEAGAAPGEPDEHAVRFARTVLAAGTAATGHLATAGGSGQPAEEAP